MTKTTEVTRIDVGNANDTMKTRIQKQHGNVALMAHVLDACDPDTYENAHGRPAWRNAMIDEYHFLMKNQTWDLVPQPKEKNAMKCHWVYKNQVHIRRHC